MRKNTFCASLLWLFAMMIASFNSFATADESEDNFVMLSAYNLLPYNADYLDRVIPSLARNNVAGILYATFGYEEKRYQDTGGQWGVENELAYNNKIYDQAKQQGADIWLQVRFYDNDLGLFARDASSFNIRTIVDNYSSRTNDCRIILFEEASIYHKPQGGGSFWFGADLSQTPQQQRSNDELFVENLAVLFSEIKSQIVQMDNTCKVGIHIGHAPVYRTIDGVPLLTNAVQKMPVGLRPDFVLYDLYAQVVGDSDRFKRILSERLKGLKNELQLPVYFMGQLHTTNHFQHGGGKSPTVDQLHTGARIARESGVDGIGFYTKNTQSSVNEVRFKNENTNVKVQAGLHEPQKTVFESSKDRFDYAMGLISNQQNTIDIVFSGIGLSRGGYQQKGYFGLPPENGRGKLSLWLKHKNGQWQNHGQIGPNHKALLHEHDSELQNYVVRGVSLDDYLVDDQLHFRLNPTGNEYTKLDFVSVVASRQLDEFKAADYWDVEKLGQESIGLAQNVSVNAGSSTEISIAITPNTVSQAECTDTDGDGWGWDGEKTCIPE